MVISLPFALTPKEQGKKAESKQKRSCLWGGCEYYSNFKLSTGEEDGQTKVFICILYVIYIPFEYIFKMKKCIILTYTTCICVLVLHHA